MQVGRPEVVSGCGQAAHVIRLCSRSIAGVSMRPAIRGTLAGSRQGLLLNAHSVRFLLRWRERDTEPAQRRGCCSWLGPVPHLPSAPAGNKAGSRCLYCTQAASNHERALVHAAPSSIRRPAHAHFRCAACQRQVHLCTYPGPLVHDTAGGAAEEWLQPLHRRHLSSPPTLHYNQAPSHSAAPPQCIARTRTLKARPEVQHRRYYALVVPGYTTSHVNKSR